jgi:hypothetical protein
MQRSFTPEKRCQTSKGYDEDAMHASEAGLTIAAVSGGAKAGADACADPNQSS